MVEGCLVPGDSSEADDPADLQRAPNTYSKDPTYDIYSICIYGIEYMVCSIWYMVYSMQR